MAVVDAHNSLKEQSGTHDKPARAAVGGRAEEVSELIDAVKDLIEPFIAAADHDEAIDLPLDPNRRNGTSLIDPHPPEELVKLLNLSLPLGGGRGKDGLLNTVRRVLQYSVNTWDRGFLDKLYSSTNAVGVASDLVLSVLNTNVHVYGVSPALTVIEKTTSRQLARLFGYEGLRAGGFTTSGGSTSNYTSLIIARNTLFPDTRTNGNGNRQFALFTSEHGHYSVETAAQACGIGSSNVFTVPVDSAGRMTGAALRSIILRAMEQGKTPLYVNATAGTTVLGSYDSFKEISAVCKEFGVWMHIDGSWGGPVIFSAKQRHKLDGSHLADSITVNPHKMMNVPLSCSFLLGPDMNIFHQANTLPAGYLFHGDTSGGGPSPEQQDAEVWDLADYTLQCGRRGDSLKLALAWIYYGAAGFERRIDNAFDTAAYLAAKLQRQSDFVVLSTIPPPCLQVCFYYAPDGKLADSALVNTRRTKQITAALLHRGFMIDYAPGDRGSFFRVVVNSETQQDTMDRLVVLLQDVGSKVGNLCQQRT